MPLCDSLSLKAVPCPEKKIATEKILLECRGINNRSANYYCWYGRLDTWLHGENTEVCTHLTVCIVAVFNVRAELKTMILAGINILNKVW